MAERLEEICNGFENENTCYLIAKSEGIPIGVIGYVIQGDSGMIRGWEPGVRPEHQDSGVAEKLLLASLDNLRAMDLKAAWCWLKCPYEPPEAESWYRDLFAWNGLVQQHLGVAQMLLDLRRIEPRPISISGVDIVDVSGFTSDDIAELSYRTFFSTHEERLVHTLDLEDWDEDKERQKLKDVISSQLDSSSPDCWRVALVEGEPVGLAGSWRIESKYRPSTAGISSVGVIPEFRRRGIASALLNNVHHALKEHDINNAFLGVSDINHGAIELYEQFGYKHVFRVSMFRKSLRI